MPYSHQNTGCQSQPITAFLSANITKNITVQTVQTNAYSKLNSGRRMLLWKKNISSIIFQFSPLLTLYVQISHHQRNTAVSCEQLVISVGSTRHRNVNLSSTSTEDSNLQPQKCIKLKLKPEAHHTSWLITPGDDKAVKLTAFNTTCENQAVLMTTCLFQSTSLQPSFITSPLNVLNYYLCHLRVKK